MAVLTPEEIIPQALCDYLNEEITDNLVTLIQPLMNNSELLVQILDSLKKAEQFQAQLIIDLLGTQVNPELSNVITILHSLITNPSTSKLLINTLPIYYTETCPKEHLSAISKICTNAIDARLTIFEPQAAYCKRKRELLDLRSKSSSTSNGSTSEEHTEILAATKADQTPVPSLELFEPVKPAPEETLSITAQPNTIAAVSQQFERRIRFSISFANEAVCSQKYSELCKMAQQTGLDDTADIFAQNGHEIVFYKSAMHCGILLPRFFISLPTIRQKIYDETGHTRSTAGNTSIVLQNYVLNLKDSDLNPQPEKLQLANEAANRITVFPLTVPNKTKAEQFTNGNELIERLSLHNGFAIEKMDDFFSWLTTTQSFLIENFSEFYIRGFRTLFCSNLLHDDHQKLFDHWHDHPAEPMPRELELYLWALDFTLDIHGEYPANYTGIIREVHEKGFHIVALGNSQTDIRQQTTADSDLVQNANMAEQVRQNIHGKYIILCDSHNLKGHGVDKLLGIPSLAVYEGKYTPVITTDFLFQMQYKNKFRVENMGVLDSDSKKYLDNAFFYLNTPAGMIANPADILKEYCKIQKKTPPESVLEYILSKARNLDVLLVLFLNFLYNCDTSANIVNHLWNLLEKIAVRENLPRELICQIYILILIQSSAYINAHYLKNGNNVPYLQFLKRIVDSGYEHALSDKKEPGQIITIPENMNGIDFKSIFIHWYNEVDEVKKGKIATALKDILYYKNPRMFELLDAAQQFCDGLPPSDSPPMKQPTNVSSASMFKPANKVEQYTYKQSLHTTLDKIRQSLNEGTPNTQNDYFKYIDDELDACRALIHHLIKAEGKLPTSSLEHKRKELLIKVNIQISILFSTKCKTEIKSLPCYNEILASCKSDYERREITAMIDNSLQFQDLKLQITALHEREHLKTPLADLDKYLRGQDETYQNVISDGTRAKYQQIGSSV